MIVCDSCGKDCSKKYLTEVNPEGGFGMPRYLMCDECLDQAPEGSLAAEMREFSDEMRKRRQ